MGSAPKRGRKPLPTPCTTATPRTPTRRWPRASTRSGLAGRSEHILLAGSGTRARRVSRRRVRPPHSRHGNRHRARSAGAGKTRRDCHRRRRLARDAERRANARGRRRTVDRICGRGRARAGFSGSRVRRCRVPAHADARARLAHSAVGVVSRGRASAGLRLSGDRQRRRATGDVAQGRARDRTERSKRIACSARGDVARELDRHGFRITSTHKQFVLPIALHKAVGSAGFTRRLEGVLAGAGMLRLAGSPVTIAAERCAS